MRAITVLSIEQKAGVGQEVQIMCNRQHTELGGTMREKEREDLPGSDTMLGAMDNM